MIAKLNKTQKCTKSKTIWLGEAIEKFSATMVNSLMIPQNANH